MKRFKITKVIIFNKKKVRLELLISNRTLILKIIFSKNISSYDYF